MGILESVVSQEHSTKVENSPSTEHFSNPNKSQSVDAFIDFLKSRFSTHAEHIGLELSDATVQVEKVPDVISDQLLELLNNRFAEEHAQKFGLVIKGIYRTDQLQPVPDDISKLAFHGTDPTRGSKILQSGFDVPEKRKVDPNPMYGTGVSATTVSSKAAPYFGESGYNSRSREQGLIFFLDPKAEKPFESKAALWGDQIALADGSRGRWQDSYDSVIAISKKDGGNSTASNLPEMTLRHGSQANPVAVAWVELIPATDPSFRQKFKDGLVQDEPVAEDAEPAVTGHAELLSAKLHDFFWPVEESEAKTVETTHSQGIDRFAKENGISVVSVVDAEYVSQLKCEQQFGDFKGLPLAPKEAVIMAVPKDSVGIIRNIILKHRKDKWYQGRTQRRYVGIKPHEIRRESDGKTSVYRRNTGTWFTLDPEISYLTKKGNTYNERDTHPAQTKIMVHSAESNTWYYLGTKIGEPRPASEPEEERLYDLSLDEIVDYIALIGWGNGDRNNATTHIHSAEIITYPELNNSVAVNEMIYTKGVHFYDLKSSFKHEAYYPEDNNGLGYPNSVCIGGYEHQPFDFETTPTNTLEISPRPNEIGKVLASLEVACGDNIYENVPGQSRSGWALLSAYVQTAEGKRFRIIESEGVPPRGILSGSTTEKYKIQPGDKIVLKSDQHPLWVMGYRIIFKD